MCGSDDSRDLSSGISHVCGTAAVGIRLIPVGPWFVQTIQECLVDKCLSQIIPLHPLAPELVLFTDASLEGYGAHLGDQHLSGVWSAFERSLHMNLLEMEAVRRACLQFRSIIRHRRILLRFDNAAVVAYLNRWGGTKSESLSRKALEIQELCDQWGIVLMAKHIPSSVNVLADALSRCSPVQTEWMLHKVVAGRILHLWGSLQVDMFATRLNHQLPVFVSPVPDTLALEYDALSMDWTGLDLYAFPSPVLLSKVLPRSECNRDARGAGLGSPTMVSSASVTVSAGAGALATPSGSAQPAAAAAGVAPEAGGLPSSRVEVVEFSLLGRGFLERIAELVSSSKRRSTERVYQCHWSAWVRWAGEQDFDPLSPTVNDLAEYFLALVQERKLKVQTVKSHRSSIFTTLRQCGRTDFSTNLALHDLLKSLQSTVERPSILPKRDVFLVLHALKGLPYEPLRFATLRLLTWKTLFLVSLAVCRRISEIHAFLHDLVDYNSDGSVTLRTDPIFVAIIQSLSRTLPSGNSDRLLCPVRALKYYLHRTILLRGGKKRLFISYTKQPGDITKNALSQWIAATIKLAELLSSAS
ncbi:uncharacterized protein LOC121389361 [Gigantopelta aegis]|uniref:uncharacterized protein LOC121389361 n=1 Tax=Gigantopelta aegis TaxID=1735272 RepID=UPI001B889037|nr:uncharacterized protein LOC121389361 [Gigantopelta aegis]